MIAIACVHGGFELKTAIIRYFNEKDIPHVDLGTFDTKSVDYPDIAIPCATIPFQRK